MPELTSRERVLTALTHEEPDRVPIIFGTEGSTSMLAPGYKVLKRHLGLAQQKEVRLFSRSFQYARIDEEVMAFFQTDFRPLLGLASSRYADREIDELSFTDCWGITWTRPPSGMYYAMASHPLQEARTPKDILDYAWPDPEDILDLSGLADQAKRLRQETPYAIAGTHEGPTSIFEMAWYLRGFSEFMLDLVSNQAMAHALLRQLTDLAVCATAKYLEGVGEYLDLFRIGDDLGMQTGPIVSPKTFRKMVKPYLGEYFSLIHSKTNAALMMHTCGGVVPIIEDLIEIGVNVLNPIQVSANDMDPRYLKQDFGDQLCFCGGIDTHRVLPQGTPDQVRDEVRRRIREMAPGGGYLLAAVHAIQPDVPPENVCAMFDAALEYGQYPIQ